MRKRWTSREPPETRFSSSPQYGDIATVLYRGTDETDSDQESSPDLLEI